MLFFFDEDDEIAGGTASFAGVTATADAELHSFLYAGGDVDRDRFFAVYPAFALTNGAFGGDDGALAITARAGGDGLHLAEEGVADPAYLAAAPAGAAGLDAIFVFRAAAAAGITTNVFFDLDVLGNSLGYFFVIELDLYAKIATPDSFGPAIAATTAAAAEEAAKYVVAKDVSELAEDVIHVHITAAAESAAAAIAGDASMSVAVVLAAFVCVAEHFVGFCGFSEFLFCGLVPGVTIGVELHSYFPISFLYLIGRGALGYSQYFVIISF